MNGLAKIAQTEVEDRAELKKYYNEDKNLYTQEAMKPGSDDNLLARIRKVRSKIKKGLK
jgi:hypothetical protein